MSADISHECFAGLLTCSRHPRWKVVRPFKPQAALAYPWWVYRPAGTGRSICVERCATWAEAVAYATAQARAQMVAAVQDGAA